MKHNSAWKKSSFFFICLGYILAYTGLGIWMAVQSHDSNFEFQVFRAYRMVFNNLNFPEVTGWNAMTHPADASDLHLYSTLFGPAYVWWMTAWSKVFGFTPVLLRMGGVLIYFPPLVFGVLAYARQFGGRPMILGLFFVLAPLLFLTSISCDWIVFSLGFYLLLCAELLKKDKSFGLIYLWSFLAVFFQFLNAVHLLIFIILNFIWQRGSFRKGSLHFSEVKVIVGGVISALGLSYVSSLFADERIMSFLEYVMVRGDQAVLTPHDFSFYLFTLERVWGQMTYNFPLFLLFMISLGVVLTAEQSKFRQSLLLLIMTHFIYCSLLMGTTAAHYYYSFFYLLLTPAMVSSAYHVCLKRNMSYSYLWAVPFVFLLLLLSAYEFRKTGIWSSQENRIDEFLLEMKPEDLLLRDQWYDTWPLNYNNPINTAYLDPKEDPHRSFPKLSDGQVYGYELTWNSAYHVRPKYQGWRAFEPTGDGEIYFLTEKAFPQFKLIIKEQRSIVHEGTKTFYLYHL